MFQLISHGLALNFMEARAQRKSGHVKNDHWSINTRYASSVYNMAYSFSVV